MKITMSFHGACLVEYRTKARSATVHLLNAFDERSPTPTIYHHPLLVVERRFLNQTSTAPRVASLLGLLDSKAFEVEALAGWHLSGHSLRVGSAGPTLLHQDWPELPPHPPNASGPWGDWRWIPNLSRIQPGCALRTDHQAIGDRTLAQISLNGGTIKGGTPTDRNGSVFVWSFSPAYQQAVTDNCEFEWEVASDTVVIEVAGRTVQLEGSDHIRLRVINEAPPAEMRLQRMLVNGQVGMEETPPRELPRAGALPQLRNEHFIGYYRALTGGIYDALERPAATWKFDRRDHGDTPYCSNAIVEVDE